MSKKCGKIKKNFREKIRKISHFANFFKGHQLLQSDHNSKTSNRYFVKLKRQHRVQNGIMLQERKNGTKLKVMKDIHITGILKQTVINFQYFFREIKTLKLLEEIVPKMFLNFFFEFQNLVGKYLRQDSCQSRNNVSNKTLLIMTP